jgi:RNA polymerase sigma factor (sigma-70 family)
MAAQELSTAGRSARGLSAPGRKTREKSPPKNPIPWTHSSVSDSVQRMGIPADRLPDETLLAGLGAGDAELSLAFVRRFQRVVFGVAVTVLGDPTTAEDVAQQTFERAWRHAQVYDTRRGSVRAWMSTIAHNLAVDVLRARTSTPVDPQDLPALLTAMTDTPERFAVAHDNAAGLRRALAALPAGQARAVAMAGIYGMTARQIAEAEGVPLGTAKTRIRDGMEKLRSAYLREDVGDD